MIADQSLRKWHSIIYIVLILIYDLFFLNYRILMSDSNNIEAIRLSILQLLCRQSKYPEVIFLSFRINRSMMLV